MCLYAVFLFPLEWNQPFGHFLLLPNSSRTWPHCAKVQDMKMYHWIERWKDFIATSFCCIARESHFTGNARNISFGLKIMRSLYCQATRSHPANKQTNNQATNDNDPTIKRQQNKTNHSSTHNTLTNPHLKPRTTQPFCPHFQVLTWWFPSNVFVRIMLPSVGLGFGQTFGKPVGFREKIQGVCLQAFFLQKTKTMALVWILNERFFFTNQV